MIQTDLMEMILLSLHTLPKLSLTYDELYEFKPLSIDAAVQSGILKPGPESLSVRCNNCPEECILNVEYERDDAGHVVRAYTFCPDPGEESRFIMLDVNRLKTWCINASRLACCICEWLNLGSVPSNIKHNCIWRLGQFKVPRSSYTVFLAFGLGSPSVEKDAIELLESAIQDSLCALLLVPTNNNLHMKFPSNTTVIPLANLLIASEKSLGLDTDAVKNHLASLQVSQEKPVPFGYMFSPDYRTVWRLDKMHALSEPQAQIISILHQAWVDGHLYLHYKTILDNIDTSSTRMQDVFKNKEDALHDLLVNNGSGSYALNIPEEK